VREQDLTPTFKQSVEGVGSVTDTPPTAEAAWRDFSGTAFLYKQSDSPGDLTRPFICDADNTRPGQLTAWLQWPGGSTVTVDDDGSGNAPNGIQAIVNDSAGWGFVGTANSGLVVSYWRWNGTKFAYQRAIHNGIFGQSSSRLPSEPYTVRSGSRYPIQTVVPTGTNLWTATTSGMLDISTVAAPEVGVSGATTTFVYFDILFVIAKSGGNLTITPYRPNTPATGNILQSVTYTGLAPALATIPGESVCMGAVPCEGAVYIVTDRSVYGFQWNDLTNTMLTTKLLELPRITSPPVVWNGEVYIGADNRIIHIVPGQRGFDWRVPDPAGRSSVPMAGTITALTTAPDALFAQIVDTNTTTNAGWCIMRMDADGIWTLPFISNTFVFSVPYSPPIPVVDGTNPFGLACFNGVTTISSATILPFPQAGRNPRTLAVAQRAQQAGPFRCITPWYDLESETAQKQLERFRTSVQSTSTAYPVRVYYQTDYADEGGSDTFATGVCRGTGVWHLCGYLGTSSTAYAGSTDANGNGALWWEFDHTTSYPNSVGVLPQYPTYKRVRWCLEINGDTTGATVPTVSSHAFHRLEYVTKAYERDIAIRLRVAETQGASQRGATVVRYANNAAIKTARDTIRALNSAKTVCTYVDEWGDNHTVVVTKYQSNLTAIDGNGLPGEYILNLSLMDVPLQGQN
jgi:hypothetical protein